MSEKEVVVVATGTANLASILAGFKRLDARTEVSRDPAVIESAEYLVLPGVGAFAAAMRPLVEYNLVDILRARIEAGLPTLCVCLGLQILAADSDEDPGVEGLAVVPGRIKRFPDTVRVPQLGWNTVEPDDDCRLIRPGYAYFANSYCLADVPPGWRVAQTTHGMPFIAAMERDRVLACQFHPELSGVWGLALLRRWLDDDGEKMQDEGTGDGRISC